MTNQKKYVAYVSTYTMGDNHGITIYDVDVENGRFTLKDRVEITNSSYLTISHNRKWLYSITDFGVESYEILKDGHLKPINMAGINGMRGWYLFPKLTGAIFPQIMKIVSCSWQAGMTARSQRCV